MLTVPATTLLPTVANKRYIRLHRLHVHSPRLLLLLVSCVEEDAAEVLAEAQVDVERALAVPDGYKISDPPSDEALLFSKPPSEASKALVGRRIMRKWEGFGWCSGEITRVNDDARRSIAGDKVNFFAHYEIDGDDEDDVPHVLELAEYRMTDDAEYDSWLLLEALEADTLDAEPQAAAQDTTAMEM